MPDRTVKNRYKPAVLINATFEHVKSADEFLDYFFTYVYGSITAEEEHGTGSVHQAFTYFRDFSLWNSKRKGEAVVTMDKFAEYMIDKFFMPRQLAFVSVLLSILLSSWKLWRVVPYELLTLTSAMLFEPPPSKRRSPHLHHCLQNNLLPLVRETVYRSYDKNAFSATIIAV